MENQKYSDAVRQIKQAILSSQCQAAKGANAVQLSLYYGIGRYVSNNTRQGVWGTGAIEIISEQLQKELPGLRGFSSANIKKMRIFHDQWSDILKSSPVANEIDVNSLLPIKSSPVANQLSYDEFLGISFSHHMEILHKTESVQERLFYIHQTFIHQWSKYTLRDMLNAGIYHHQSNLSNNFMDTMPDKALEDSEIIPFRYPGGIEGLLQNEILPYTPDAWIDLESIQTGYELSFTKYFYKPKELRTIAEISKDIRDIEKRTDGMLNEILG